MTQTTRRARQPRLPIEVRRQQVLDAALRLISQHGYRAASMEAIARECDLAKPSVYNAYPGRGPLLKALLEREEQRGLQAVATALGQLTPDQDLDAAVGAAMRTFFESVCAHPVTWQMILSPTEDLPREAREHVQAGRAFALDGLRRFVHTATRHRPDAHELDLELAARSLFAVLEQAAKLVLADPAQFTPERLARFGHQILAPLHP
jgi:AcrR family transcriptional regulator